MCVCIYVYMCLCISLSLYLYIYTHIYIYIYIDNIFPGAPPAMDGDGGPYMAASSPIPGHIINK